jgi:hypothetical protein
VLEPSRRYMPSRLTITIFYTEDGRGRIIQTQEEALGVQGAVLESSPMTLNLAYGPGFAASVVRKRRQLSSLNPSLAFPKAGPRGAVCWPGGGHERHIAEWLPPMKRAIPGRCHGVGYGTHGEAKPRGALTAYSVHSRAAERLCLLRPHPIRRTVGEKHVEFGDQLPGIPASTGR